MSISRNLPPELLAALAHMLAQSVTNAITIDSKSSVPVREQIAIQIDAIVGEGSREHAESCEDCTANREKLIDRVYKEYLADHPDHADTGIQQIEAIAKAAADEQAKKDADNRLRRAEQSTNAALGQNEARVGSTANAAFAAPYGADGGAGVKRKAAAYAAVVQRNGQDSVLHFTTSATEEKARAALKHAENTISITFNDYEIKPLYL